MKVEKIHLGSWVAIFLFLKLHSKVNKPTVKLHVNFAGNKRAKSFSLEIK
jgi:hypothetical protein